IQNASLFERIPAMSKHIVIATLVAIAAAGCGKSEQQKAAEQAAEASKQAAQASQQAAQAVQQGAQQMPQGEQQTAQGGVAAFAQGLQALAQGLQQTGADGKPVPPVDFEKLIALLPDIPGWTKDKPTGETTSMGVSVSNAETRYTKGDAHVSLKITDAAFNGLFLAPWRMMTAMGYSKRNSEGFERATTVGGTPAYEKWTNDSKNGEVTILVGNRFVVEADGSGFDSIDGIRNFVTSVDLAKLAATK